MDTEKAIALHREAIEILEQLGKAYEQYRYLYWTEFDYDKLSNDCQQNMSNLTEQYDNIIQQLNGRAGEPVKLNSMN